MSIAHVCNGTDLISFKKLSKSKVIEENDDVWSINAIENFETDVKLPDIFHHKTSTQKPSAHDEKMERRRLRQNRRSQKNNMDIEL
jgi:hypothetical protein